MGALLALAVRLAGLGASGLGIGLPAFALVSGLALGAGPAGYAGWLLGKWRGYAIGYAAADAQAEVNRLARDLAEARLDAAAARAASTAARAASLHSAASAAQARKQTDAYARDLAARGKGGPCGLDDGDLVRLRGDAWAVQRGARGAHSAARR